MNRQITIHISVKSSGPAAAGWGVRFGFSNGSSRTFCGTVSKELAGTNIVENGTLEALVWALKWVNKPAICLVHCGNLSLIRYVEDFRHGLWRPRSEHPAYALYQDLLKELQRLPLSIVFHDPAVSSDPFLKEANGMAELVDRLSAATGRHIDPFEYNIQEPSPEDRLKLWQLAFSEFGDEPIACIDQLRSTKSPAEAAADRKTAEFVSEVQVQDPDTGEQVEVAIFKDQNSGCMLGVDSQMLEQMGLESIPDPFNSGMLIALPKEHEPRAVSTAPGP
jgi:hypothetical protein